MKRIPSSHYVGRKGILSVGTKVNDLGWIFREQDEDFGIDALIEVARNQCPTGMLIAAQIKAGQSFFKEPCAAGFVFRGKTEHLDYWLKHKLPVIVVLYDLNKDVGYWQSVTKDSAKSTSRGWKMVIPKNQTIDKAGSFFSREGCRRASLFSTLNRAVTNS